MLTLAEARERVKTNCSAAADPALTDAEVEACCTDTARAVPWVTATAYAVGTTVAPTARTGHYYQVVTAGTSGAMEPTWPTTDRSTAGDGTVIWQEAGPDAAELYDLRAATHAAWRLKMSKAAAASFNFSTDGQSFSMQDVINNIERNLRLWVPVGIG